MDTPSNIPYGLAIIVGLPLIVLIWIVVTSNRINQLRNLIKESWSDIDVQLKRRHDLIPNLVETVKGYATHEQTVLDRVMQARSMAMAPAANTSEVIAQETALVTALNGLMVRVEAYPQLKASAHFLALQQELANTEDRIAAARRFYNANVRDFNTMCQSFPSSVIANSKNLSPVPFFEVDSVAARDPVAVDMGSFGPGPGLTPGPH
jgi:LemA protein